MLDKHWLLFFLSPSLSPLRAARLFLAPRQEGANQTKFLLFARQAPGSGSSLHQVALIIVPEAIVRLSYIPFLPRHVSATLPLGVGLEI